MQQRKGKQVGIRVLVLSLVLAAGLLAEGTDASAAASWETKPAQVTHLTVQAKGARAAVIRFQRVQGASGYLLYQATAAKGPYKRVKALKGNRSTSCTRKHLKAGIRYWYKARAYSLDKQGKRIYGRCSAAASIPITAKGHLAQVNHVSLKAAGTNGVTITFSPVSSAAGYQIYRAAAKDGAYGKVRTLTGRNHTSDTQKGLKADTRYWYQVRAYKQQNGKRVYGAFSARRSVWTDAATPPAPGQVTDLKLQKGEGKIILTFSPVEGADGYCVYERKNGAGTWKDGYQELADLQGQEATSYVKTDAEYGVTYYFKVRAYREGQKRGKPIYVYGLYSNLVGGILTEEDHTGSTEMPEDAPYQEVDLMQVLADLEEVQRTGQELYKGMDTQPYGYAYSIYPSGNVLVGYLDKWETECSSYNGSEAGPWYGANFALKLASSECTAYYTTDGSLPSLENGTRVTKAMGRVKLRAAHTAKEPSERETLDVKIHFYVKGKLVALRYYYSTNAACYHSYPEGNGLTVERVLQNFGTLEAYLEWNRQYHREDWQEYLPENEALLRLKAEDPSGWWEQVPGDGRSLYF